MTGNIWGDAIVSSMMEKGAPVFLSLPAGQLYVEVLDKLIALFLVYVILKLNDKAAGRKYRRLRPDRQEQEGESEEEKAKFTGRAGMLAVLLAVSLALPGMTVRAQAEEVRRTAADNDYSDYVQTIYLFQSERAALR